MSIYNGFGTRLLEKTYSKTLFSLIILLQKEVVMRLIKEKNQSNHKFFLCFEKIYVKLVNLEQHKYLPPKYSKALRDLASFFGI